MSERPALHRVLASLHEAALDDAHFPTCSALIDDACGTHGNILTFARGQSRDDVEIYLARLYYRANATTRWSAIISTPTTPGTNGSRA